MYFLYDDTGEYQGATKTPEDFPNLNYTDIAPGEYDDFKELIFFINGAWEIRTIQENNMPMGKGQRGGKKKKKKGSKRG